MKVLLGQTVFRDTLLKICVCFQRVHREVELFHHVLNIVLLVCNLKR